MYALRDKKSQEFLKLSCGPDGHGGIECSIERCDRIEMNYWVTPSLGFLASVLKQETDGEECYAPTIGYSVDPQSLEVVDLITHRVLSLDEVFDGYDLDDREIPPIERLEVGESGFQVIEIE